MHTLKHSSKDTMVLTENHGRVIAVVDYVTNMVEHGEVETLL
jgi:hypothetical protein